MIDSNNVVINHLEGGDTVRSGESGVETSAEHELDIESFTAAYDNPAIGEDLGTSHLL